MKKLLLVLPIILLLSSCRAYPQAQIPLTGSIGVSGTAPILGVTPISFTTDANVTMTYSQASANFLAVTSSISLTATRSLIAPLTKGQEFTIQNSTTGGQSITVIGATGTGVTIPNGQTMIVVCDGTNYITTGGLTAPVQVNQGGTSKTTLAAAQAASIARAAKASLGQRGRAHVDVPVGPEGCAVQHPGHVAPRAGYLPGLHVGYPVEPLVEFALDSRQFVGRQELDLSFARLLLSVVDGVAVVGQEVEV